MKISILTMFPEMFEGFLHSPVPSHAIAKGIAEVEIIDIKDFAHGSFRHIDDSPYGGGAGMILRCQPVLEALQSVKTEQSYTIMTAAAGVPYHQSKAHAFAEKEHLIIICGHYEGIDARVMKHVDEPVSIGDYVVTGGEYPAMIISHSIIRLLDGVIKQASTEEESYENGLLEYPQYTRPAVYQDDAVPSVLMSGNHEAIRRWRLKESLRMTKQLRPDLLKQRTLSKEEQKLLQELEDEDRKSH